MTLSAQFAVLSELRAENTAMRALLAEILAADMASINSLTRLGYAPKPELFPFTERIKALLPVAHTGLREFVAPIAVPNMES